jgi:hypothetical protein
MVIRSSLSGKVGNLKIMGGKIRELMGNTENIFEYSDLKKQNLHTGLSLFMDSTEKSNLLSTHLSMGLS